MIKTILCYGDSYVWGCVPGSFNPMTGLWTRFTKDKRWTGVLARYLGKNFEVITEGINGRTTTLDEVVPGRPYRNGLIQLPAVLESHYPIDLVIFMLGTNDTKIQFNCSAEQITEGMRQLIQIVKTSKKGNMANPPQVLLIAPPKTTHSPQLTPQRDAGSIAKSLRLPALYQRLAQQENCAFLDASVFLSSSLLDGVHLDEHGNQSLGKLVAKKVREILGTTTV